MDYTFLIVVGIVVAVLEIFNIGYALFKHKPVDFNVIAGIAVHAVMYVEQVYKLETNSDKKQFAENAIKDTLVAMNIPISSQTTTMIEIAIESAVQLLPKTNDK